MKAERRIPSMLLDQCDGFFSAHDKKTKKSVKAKA
jgi:hypothetical protein